MLSWHNCAMEQWTDQAIVLTARPHGEGGAVLSLLTAEHGRHMGYVHGAKSTKMRGLLEAGTLLEVNWQSRVADQLGYYTFEHGRNAAALIMDEPLKLAALLSACSLCDVALPEREKHAGLFYGLQALIDMFQSDVWGCAYILWEIALLKELGFGMNLTRCVAGGDVRTLTYVSPKSGCAVSLKEGYAYRDKLLSLPNFLKPEAFGDDGGHYGERGGVDDVVKGLKLTGYFLEHWVFTHHTHGIPDARLRFASLFATKYPLKEESAA